MSSLIKYYSRQCIGCVLLDSCKIKELDKICKDYQPNYPKMTYEPPYKDLDRNGKEVKDPMGLIKKLEAIYRLRGENKSWMKRKRVYKEDKLATKRVLEALSSKEEVLQGITIWDITTGMYDNINIGRHIGFDISIRNQARRMVQLGENVDEVKLP